MYLAHQVGKAKPNSRGCFWKTALCLQEPTYSDILKRKGRWCMRFAVSYIPSSQERSTIWIVQWRLRKTKRNRGTPQRRCIDDIRETIGNRWVHIAQNRQDWRRHGEVYVQKWINESWGRRKEESGSNKTDVRILLLIMGRVRNRIHSLTNIFQNSVPRRLTETNGAVISR